MTNRSIRFPCPRCRARIKAPVQLLGEQRRCPGCSHRFTVKRDVPEDAGPRLVLLERGDRFVLGVA